MKISVWDAKSCETLPEEYFDCYIAEYLLREGRSIPDKTQTFVEYGVETLAALAQKQKQKLAAEPELLKLLKEIEFPIIGVLRSMEARGIMLDTARLHDVGREVGTAITNLETDIRKEIDSTVNLQSATQLGSYLATTLGVPLSKTKTGRFATNEQELQKHMVLYPIVSLILEYRELSKLRSTYIESLISKVGEDQRIHTTYQSVGVSTGRLSSQQPNLQNIPVSSEYGRKIKSCFQASPGYNLVSFDYSQQELRILAHLSGETGLITAFKDNRDVHTTTASQLFSVPYDHVTKDQRMVAKTVNFGIIYGMGSFGLSQGLHIPVEDAQRFIDRFYETYPKIKHFYDQYLKHAKIKRYATTMLGRKRYVFEYPKQTIIDNATKRILMNYPIQGSAAELTKLAMIAIHKQILSKRDDVFLLLQIHDDLVFEIQEDKTEKLIPMIKEIMCTVYPLSVPIEVDVHIGKKWGEWE